MRPRSVTAAVMFGFLMSLASISLGPGLAAEAAEIKVLSVLAFRPALDELGPSFEKETAHKLAIEYDVVGALKRKVEGGAEFDVAIITPQFIEDLAKQGKIAAGSQANIARSGIGVLVRTGAPKPDITSADAFKRAML